MREESPPVETITSPHFNELRRLAPQWLAALSIERFKTKVLNECIDEYNAGLKTSK